MKQNTNPDGIEQQPTEVDQAGREQAPEGEARDRRSFLTSTAIGVAGAAGMLAIGAKSTQAASAKSKILDRIKTQMAAQDIVPIEEEGGGDAYIKNAHSLYLKR